MMHGRHLPVSVVIPTYKRPGFLQHCLRCLMLQASPQAGFEVIVVSDGEDPASEKVVIQYADTPHMTVRFLSLPVKKGPAAARNLGWQSATGELIIFTDDDCLPTANFIIAYTDAYRKQRTSLVAFTGKVVVPLTGIPTDYEKNIAQLSTAEFITANCACSKAALMAVNGFDEQFTMAWREDSELQFKFISHNIPVLRIDNAVIIHPVRPARWGVSIKEQKKSMFNALLLKKHPQLFRKKIYNHPIWNYYAILMAVAAAIVLLLTGHLLPAALAVLMWISLSVLFAFKRLQSTSRSASHITEMMITSAVIPLLSVYWTLYGSWRYKTLLL